MEKQALTGELSSNHSDDRPETAETSKEKVEAPREQETVPPTLLNGKQSNNVSDPGVVESMAEINSQNGSTEASQSPEGSDNGSTTEGTAPQTDEVNTGESSVSEEEEQPESPTEEQEKAEIDYSQWTKQQVLDGAVELLRNDDVQSIIAALAPLKQRFDALEEEERNQALEQFIAEGGDKDAFDYQNDEVARKFFANYQLLRDRRQRYYKELEQQKEVNLHTKNEILEQLREIVDGEETVTSIKVINEIREKWRNTGPIPRQFNKTLWANYNALMDRFYDNRSIYFELKELDRKKNLELKIELCERVEALVAEDDLQKAINELNSLHEDFKHIGPVPQENQEELWLRFKAASDSIYARRKVFIDEVKDQLQANLVEKTALCEQIEAYVNFASDRITEWNDKTREVQELQKKWEAVGGLPRDKSKKVNRRFWSAFKSFFSNKSKFFKSLEGQREDNLILKEALVKKVEDLKNSEDFIKTAELIKKLQKEWREIGPVPDKQKNEIYQKFKAACDEFFDRKRASVKVSEKEFEQNLVLKNEVCDQLEEISQSDKIDLDLVETLQTRFSEIGFVPRNGLKKINKRYNDVLGVIKEKLDSSGLANKEQLSMEIEIRKLKGRPGSDREMQKQESNLRRKISAIENNISTWRNNLEFFRDSKTAEKFKKEFDVKINEANDELKQLKKQLRMMETA